VFLSQYTYKIDSKGRISVPADFRIGINTKFFNGIIAFRSYKFKAIEGLDFGKMKKIADSLDDLDFFSETKNDITTSILSDSYKLPFDGEGRICIPNELLKFANIKNQATFVGRGSSFQIWNPILFKNYLEKARNNIKKKKLSLVIKNTNNDKK
tara:strand:+ start:544 stop:1005 length:462 start_codon:yes stop_codon:yes gene_type:complete